MKSLFAVCLLAVLSLALAGLDLYPRGCIYVNGRCSEACEVGTREYQVGCDYVMPEATCEEPNPVLDTRGEICDYSACYCEPPTVRHTPTNKCIPLEKCPNGEKDKKINK